MVDKTVYVYLKVNDMRVNKYFDLNSKHEKNVSAYATETIWLKQLNHISKYDMVSG